MSLHAPSPVTGKCGHNIPQNWDKDKCQSCVSNDPDNFYCEGQCMSKYDTNTSCSLNSLIAKNTNQCNAPCEQSGYAPTMGGCSDSYDCPKGSSCRIIQNRGYCIKNPEHKSPQRNFPTDSWQALDGHWAWNFELKRKEWIPGPVYVYLE